MRDPLPVASRWEGRMNIRSDRSAPHAIFFGADGVLGTRRLVVEIPPAASKLTNSYLYLKTIPSVTGVGQDVAQLVAQAHSDLEVLKHALLLCRFSFLFFSRPLSLVLEGVKNCT